MPITLLVAAHLAETTLVCLGVGALALTLHRAPARTRHTLWLVVAMKLLLPSALLFWIGARVGWSPQVAPFRVANVMVAPVTGTEAAGRAPRAGDALGPFAAAVWLLGTGVAGTRVMRRHRRQAAIVARAERPSAGREWRALRHLQAAVNGDRDVPLALSAEITEPALWGLMRPVIVLPAGLGGQLSDAELESILAHELAHVRRGDLGVGLVQALLATLLWFHPVVWLVNRRLMVERERACDEDVLRRFGRRDDYLASLAKVVRFGLGRSVVWVSQFGGSPLGRRLEMIRRFDVGHGPSWLHATGVTLAVTGVLAASLFTAAVTRASSNAGTAAGGRIAGTVYDESGAFVPGAAVTISSEPAGVTASGTTDAAGSFALSAGTAGNYTLEVSRPGFKKFKRTGIAVADAEQRADAVLSLGGVSEKMTVKGAATTEARGASAGAAGHPRAGGEVKGPRIVHQVPPRYPEAAKIEGVEGRVRLDASIGKDGQVTAVKLVEPAHPALVEAAMEAVRQWRYEPTRLNGVPAEVTLAVTLNFQLDKTAERK